MSSIDETATLTDGEGVPASARGPLDRARIVAEAIAFVDEHSLAELTMRRLGQRLGVEAMSLYRYVRGRDDLLDAMVEATLSPLDTGAYLVLSGDDRWQAYLQRLAHQVRDIALTHPQVFPLVATRHPDAPWLRPPLRSLDLVEAFLQALVGRGFTDDAAVAAYRAFSSFLLGHLLLEVATCAPNAASPDQALAQDPAEVETPHRHEPLARHPQLQRLERCLSRDDSAEEFESSLQSLLRRLERTLGDEKSAG